MKNCNSKVKIDRKKKQSIARISPKSLNTQQVHCCKDINDGFEFTDIRNVQPPQKKGIYLIRIKERGKDVRKIMRSASQIVKKLKWERVEKQINERIERLGKINECQVIYIGAAGIRKENKSNLKKRYENFSKLHTIMFPIWALVYFGWKLEFGWKETNKPEEAEEDLKQRYRDYHNNKLPALVKN